MHAIPRSVQPSVENTYIMTIIYDNDYYYEVITFREKFKGALYFYFYLQFWTLTTAVYCIT